MNQKLRTWFTLSSQRVFEREKIFGIDKTYQVTPEIIFSTSPQIGGSSIRIPDSDQSNIFFKNVDYFFKNYEYQTNQEFGPVKYYFFKKMLIIFLKKNQRFFHN